MTIPLILLGMAVLIGSAGAIMMLIASFRVSMVWGLVSFFVPLGMYVFACVHWSAARLGFFVQLAAVPFCIGGAVLLAQQDSKQIEAILANPVVASLQPKPVAEATAAVSDVAVAASSPGQPLSPEIYQSRTALNQRQFSELSARYTRLTTIREKLKRQDSEAVRAFNHDVADYRGQLEAAQLEKRYLESHRPAGIPAR